MIAELESGDNPPLVFPMTEAIQASAATPDTEEDEDGLLRILFLGDVVGEAGRKAVGEMLPQMKEELKVDFAIVNGENSAAGRGITPKLCIGLMRAGAAVVTTGDHIWDQKEILSFLPTEPRLLRPANYPADNPGAGYVVLETKKGKVGVINLQGRVFMQPPLENPFTVVQQIVEEIRKETPIIFLDFHAEATSEKVAMGWFLDGKVSAVVGTHTHIPTADLKRALQSLACGKVRVLLKEPKGREVEDGDVFSFHAQLQHKLHRIKVSSIQQKESADEEHEQTAEKVFVDRQYQVGARARMRGRGRAAPHPPRRTPPARARPSRLRSTRRSCA